MRAPKLLLVLGLAVALVACSDDGGVTDSTTLTDGPLLPDAGGDGPAPILDGPVKLDSGQAAALQTVVDKLTLPKSDQEYARDLDNNGTKDNRLGGILAIMGTLGFDTQGELDTQVSSGALTLLFEVFATSLTDDQAAKMQFHMGSPLATAGEYGIAIGSPENVVLDGAITGGNFQGGPGNFQVPIPMGIQTVVLSLTKAHLTTDLSASGMQNGVLNGAIPWTDVDQKLIPSIAQMMTDALTQEPLLASFDTDKDGTITADEVRNNLLLKMLLAPDVDTDGDQKADAMSVGMAFTSKACTIVK